MLKSIFKPMNAAKYLDEQKMFMTGLIIDDFATLGMTPFTRSELTL